MNYKFGAFLEKIFNFLLFVPLFTPVVFFSGLFFPFVASKVFFFEISVLLAFIIFTINFLGRKDLALKFSPLLWTWLIFTVLAVIASVFGINPARSFWSNMERGDGVIFLLHLLVYCFLLVSSWRDEKKWQQAFRVSLIANALVLAYGFLQQFSLGGAVTTTGLRLSSTLGNPAFFASYCLISAGLAAFLFKQRAYGFYWQVFYEILIVLNLVAIVLSQTRGAILGVAVAIFSLLFFYLVKGNSKKIKLASLCILAGSIIFLAGIFFLKDQSFVNNNIWLRRVTIFSVNDYTTQTRLLSWEAAWHGFREKPIFGWGWNNYEYVFNKYFPTKIYNAPDAMVWFDRAHNAFIENFATVGFFGALVYVLMYVYLFFLSFKLEKFRHGEILAALFIGCALANFFVFESIASFVIFIFLLSFVNQFSSFGQRKIFTVQSSVKLIVVALVFLLVWFNFQINFIGLKNNHALYLAEGRAKEGDIKSAQDLYLSALSAFNRFEIRNFFGAFAMNYADKLPSYDALNLYRKAIDEAVKNTLEDPNNVKYFMTLNQLYLKAYKYDPSMLDKITALESTMVALSPARAHIYYQLGDAYFRKKDYSNALREFNQAIKLNPDIIDPYANIYSLAVISGNTILEQQTAEKLKLLEPNFFNQVDNLTRLIALYRAAGRQEDVIASFKKLISLEPNNVSNIVGLAAYYSQIGDKKNAQDLVTPIMGKNPDLDTQIKKLLGL